jgi:hypothetical protein
MKRLLIFITSIFLLFIFCIQANAQDSRRLYKYCKDFDLEGTYLTATCRQGIFGEHPNKWQNTRINLQGKLCYYPNSYYPGLRVCGRMKGKEMQLDEIQANSGLHVVLKKQFPNSKQLYLCLKNDIVGIPLTNIVYREFGELRFTRQFTGW